MFIIPYIKQHLRQTHDCGPMKTTPWKNDENSCHLLFSIAMSSTHLRLKIGTSMLYLKMVKYLE